MYAKMIILVSKLIKQMYRIVNVKNVLNTEVI
jgi:hypothetical protein